MIAMHIVLYDIVLTNYICSSMTIRIGYFGFVWISFCCCTG